MLGHKIIGSGPEHVLVMHDWFSDCSSYDSLLPYLDTKSFTYAFADLRGYGKSKDLTGSYNVDEASQDVRALADGLKWNRYHVVGHSMSGMIAQKIALDAGDRIKSVVAITPVPASGSPAPAEMMSFLKDAALANDEAAAQCVGFMTSNRHSPQFYEYKVNKWRQTAKAEARLAYLQMFSETNFQDQVQGMQTPFMVVSTEYDSPAYRQDAMRQTFLSWYPNAELTVLSNAGHYPMQEVPVNLVSVIENYLKSQAK
jgi:pimeloyl-ACP methyl ester carboxylesterase